jgi:hypothetical protein
MRSDPILFAQATQSPSKQPRYVVRIVFDTDSPACTSHSDISGVPGDVIAGVLREPSAVSQRIIPDEGRSEIGSFSFSLIDLNAGFTEKIRTKLVDDSEGIRHKTVIFYDGYQGFDFTDFQVFQTQIVQNTTFSDGVYTVHCKDITREQRKDIFEPKFTTLRDSVSASATTIPVYVTTDFSTVVHGTSWSDAPSATVGYVRIENEIIRYTGKTSDSFTGCTRGVLNTKAVEHAVDAGTTADRRTKVEEYIYLELPAVKLAWAILTGELYGSANVLPDHWHLGISTDFVRETDFTGIGPDLWNPSDDADALPLRFEGLKKTDGKRFLEKEIYLVLGCYSPVYSDGTLGLRRLPALLGDAAPAAVLTEREVISVGELVHDDDGMHNIFRINWNFDPLKDAFTRITYFTDADSVSIHGTADLKEYSFKGLHGSRHTDVVVAQRLNALRDAYAHPPELIQVTVQGSLSYLEVGDVVRLRLQNVRDYAGATNAIDRAFAIFQKTHNSARNTINFELFGSTARPLATPPGTGVTAPIPNAWYTSEGANLNTIAAIVANVMATGSHTITGAATLGASGAIFYHAGDLTIPNGCNLTITGNVQLRIRGFLTLNGTINGVGGGHAGTVDDNDAPWDAPYTGTPGFVGHSRGWDGVRDRGQVPRTPHRNAVTLPAVFTRGANDAFPALELGVVSGVLTGLPTDLRGTGGPPGGRIVAVNDSVTSVGGTGGDGGAGLAIICRGMTFGVSASITLNGDSTTSGSQVSIDDVDYYPGAGGPGGPGALLILLDGNAISIPDVTGKVIATTGGITQAGHPMPAREQVLLSVASALSLAAGRFGSPHCGYADPGLQGAWVADSDVPNVVMAALDMSNAAHRIQYVPDPDEPNEDTGPAPPPPTSMDAGQGIGGNVIAWTSPDFDGPADMIEIYASIDNDRSNAVKVGETRGTSFFHKLPFGGLYYYWVRAKRTSADGRPNLFSTWEPVSSTAGQSSNADTPGETPDAPDDLVATGKVNGILFQWSLPAYARLLGFLELFEGDTGDTFEDVVVSDPVWSGYALSLLLPKDDDDDHRYWLVLSRGGQRSVPSPVAGLVAAAASVTADLVVYASPDSVSKTATLGANPRTAITPPSTAIATGGTAPYTYAWTWFSGGSGITIDSPTFDDTTFTATHDLDGTILTGVARCTVTDNVAATATADVAVQIVFPSVG